MLEGSLWDKIIKFAIPLAVMGILQQLFNACDIAVVGRFTGDMGAASMAAVGANAPIIGLIINTFIGISLGTNVLVAYSFGKRDTQNIKNAVHTSVLLSLVLGVVIAIIGELVAEPVMASQNMPEEVYGQAVLYFRLYMLGTPVIMLYNFEAAILRGAGDSKTPLKALLVSGVLNVILNLIFVLGFGMTVDGVAYATVISNLVSALLLFIYLTKSDSEIRLDIRELRIDKGALNRILRVGVPAGLQSAVFSFANIIIQAAINSLGTVIMAASSAAFNVEIFAYNVINSFSSACTTFVGQNAGAGNFKRCKRSALLSYAEGVVFLGIVIALILVFGHWILSLFNTDEQVIEIGYQRLVIIFATYLFTISYEIMSGYLRGFGISTIPAVLTMIGICGIRLFWIFFVFPMEPTFVTIMMVYPVSLAANALLILAALLILRPAKRVGERQALS